MKFILGKKIEMQRRFSSTGQSVPVTVILAGPVKITQLRQRDKDGYCAVQVGFGTKRKLTKPLQGHLKDMGNFRYLREFRVADADLANFKKGAELTIANFESGEMVDVCGISRGKGFQGVVKRHGFAGSPASHGHKDQLRMPGSIGSGFPEHVVKGRRMAGRMGNQQATVKNLEIFAVDPAKNLLFVKGAVPGSRNSLLLITVVKEAKKEVKSPDKK